MPLTAFRVPARKPPRDDLLSLGRPLRGVYLRVLRLYLGAQQLATPCFGWHINSEGLFGPFHHRVPHVPKRAHRTMPTRPRPACPVVDPFSSARRAAAQPATAVEPQ